MADLRKFNELFTELENSVVSLSKQEADLKQQCHTLEAKQGFTENSITELTEKLRAIKAEIAEAQAEKQRMIDTLGAEYDRLKADMSTLDSKRQRMQSTLDTMQQASDAAVAEHGSVLQAKKDEIRQAEADLEEKRDEAVHVDSLIENLKHEAAGLEDAKAVKQQELQTIAAESETATRDAQIKLQGIKADVIRVQDEYADIYDKVEGKTQQYADSEKKHAEYLEYEQRANKLLETREQTLLEREQQFETEMLTSRRRNSVLDKAR